jgi:ribonuclease HI
VGSGDHTSHGYGRRGPRRAGRATSDAERRALAKANAAAPRWTRTHVQAGSAVLETDGGARGKPPRAAIGYVVYDADGSQLGSYAGAIGQASPTVAEYRALLAGVRHARELGLDPVDARSDCRLLVSHLSGEVRPGNPELAELGAAILEVVADMGTVSFTWIPGAANGAAHALVTDQLVKVTRSS